MNRIHLKNPIKIGSTFYLSLSKEYVDKHGIKVDEPFLIIEEDAIVMIPVRKLGLENKISAISEEIAGVLKKFSNK